MAQLPVYSSRNLQVGWGDYVLEGLAPDSSITFSLSSPLTDTEVGADGSVAISISPDETGTCTVSLQQNSPGNNFLSGVLNTQRENGQLVEASFTIKDPSGLVAVLRDAHIMEAPEITRGNTATGVTVDWIFFCRKLHFQSVPEDVAEATGVLADAAAAVANVNKYLR